MKKLIITIVVSTVVAIVLHLIAFGSRFTERSISDTTFIMGIFLLFIAFTSFSGAQRVFITLGYSFKSVFGLQHRKHDNLYDYTLAKEKDKISYALPLLFVGLMNIGLSVFLAIQHLNG